MAAKEPLVAKELSGASPGPRGAPTAPVATPAVGRGLKPAVGPICGARPAAITTSGRRARAVSSARNAARGTVATSAGRASSLVASLSGRPPVVRTRATCPRPRPVASATTAGPATRTDPEDASGGPGARRGGSRAVATEAPPGSRPTSGATAIYPFGRRPAPSAQPATGPPGPSTIPTAAIRGPGGSRACPHPTPFGPTRTGSGSLATTAITTARLAISFTEDRGRVGVAVFFSGATL